MGLLFYVDKLGMISQATLIAIASLVGSATVIIKLIVDKVKSRGVTKNDIEQAMENVVARCTPPPSPRQHHHQAVIERDPVETSSRGARIRAHILPDDPGPLVGTLGQVVLLVDDVTTVARGSEDGP